MRYLGGKYQIRKWVARNVIARAEYRGENNGVYVEPFIGSAAVFRELAPNFRVSHANDAHIDLMLMWKAIAEGWQPPFITPADRQRLKLEPPSAERGFAGFSCCYRGVWFGGYAGPDQVRAERLKLLEVRSAFENTVFHCVHYSELESIVTRGTVVYCDPPYGGTYGYKQDFNTPEFWRTMDAWYEKGAILLISEYNAPKHWRVFASMKRNLLMSPTSREGRYEFLFTR